MELKPQIPKGNQEVINNFWEALVMAGREVLAQGARFGYGYSILEIKFADGTPSVLIRSHTQNVRYKNTLEAINAINDVLRQTNSAGSQTFTIVRQKDGQISDVKLDEYLNVRLQ